MAFNSVVVVRQRFAELRGRVEDVAEFRGLHCLHFSPRIRGLATCAFEKYATVHEARRWAKENGHAYRPHMWRKQRAPVDEVGRVPFRVLINR